MTECERLPDRCDAAWRGDKPWVWRDPVSLPTISTTGNFASNMSPYLCGLTLALCTEDKLAKKSWRLVSFSTSIKPFVTWLTRVWWRWQCMKDSETSVTECDTEWHKDRPAWECHSLSGNRVNLSICKLSLRHEQLFRPLPSSHQIARNNNFPYWQFQKNPWLGILIHTKHNILFSPSSSSIHLLAPCLHHLWYPIPPLSPVGTRP